MAGRRGESAVLILLYCPFRKAETALSSCESGSVEQADEFILHFSPLLPPVLQGGAARQPLEELAEEADVREIQLVGYLHSRERVVLQQHFGRGDDGTVYPLLCRNSAYLPHHRAEVTLGQAEAVGIELHLVFLLAVVVDKVDEAVEDAPSIARRLLPGVRFGSEEAVEKVEIGSRQMEDDLPPVVLRVEVLPDELQQLGYLVKVVGLYHHPAVHSAAVENRRQRASQGEMEHLGRYGHAAEVEVGRHLYGLNDGAGGEKADAALPDGMLQKVDTCADAARADKAATEVGQTEGLSRLHQPHGNGLHIGEDGNVLA